ncbi:hypothetical protein BX600DRAFT_462811 [Xylariales sp. PMI_506]|nr:hypothetical protein BX600DRAFT_462811 [Xylariales sp. PMI_506]
MMNQVYAMDDGNGYFGRSECSPGSNGQYTCYFPVVSYQTCLFGASTVSSGSSVSVRIGWSDVGDLINSSIAMFGNNPASGKVGSQGQMSCPDDSDTSSMLATAWGLYHS